MQRLFASLTLVAVLVLAPIALHADTLMTGQFVITGTVQNVGTTLMFDPRESQNRNRNSDRNLCDTSQRQ